MPAFLDEDATLLAAYDGLRRGLEEAHLPRVCRRRVDGDAKAWEAAANDVSSRGATVAFAFGRTSSDRVAAAPFLKSDGSGRLPCVYVDVVSTSAGVAFSPALDRAPPAAIVRAESPLELTLPILKRLFVANARPVLLLAWAADVKSARRWRDAVEAAGFATRIDATTGEGAPSGDPITAVLDAPVGLGETPLAPDVALARAKALGVPLLSLDRGRFGRGACVVVCPDGALLGRVAAEAARRLRDGEGADRALRLSVRAVELMVDLDAADAQGFHVPLPFVAAADRVRSTKALSASERPK